MFRRVYTKGQALVEPIEEFLNKVNIKHEDIRWMYALDDGDPNTYSLPEDGSTVWIEETNNAVIYIGVDPGSVRANTPN